MVDRLGGDGSRREGAVRTEARPRRKRSQAVAEQLEEKIRAGHFAVGERLPPERELMALYQVGRPAVREALFSLQKMGLVKIGNGERSQVIEPKPDVLIRELSGAARQFLLRPDGTREFQQARILFEVALARHAAEFATAGDVRRLRDALHANERAIGQDSAFHLTDIDFHFVLASIARNSIFVALYQAMVEWLLDQMTTSGAVPQSNLSAWQAHAAIVAAIHARDPDAAEKAVREHLANVSDLFWSVKGSKP